MQLFLGTIVCTLLGISWGCHFSTPKPRQHLAVARSSHAYRIHLKLYTLIAGVVYHRLVATNLWLFWFTRLWYLCHFGLPLYFYL